MDNTRKYLRFDELLDKGDDDLTEAERAEFDALAYLLGDPAWQAHRRALLQAALAKKPH